MSSLLEYKLGGVHDIVAEAILDIRKMEKAGRMCLRFSGGKDSIVVKRLCELAGVAFETRFSRTSVDPPELLHFIHRYHEDVIIEDPRVTLFQLIIKKGFPPTRICRFCCREFKERNTCPKSLNGEIVWTTTGIRWKESAKRGKRAKVESCQISKGVTIYNPIIEFTDEQIWDFIELERLPYCGLYDEGFSRIGCVYVIKIVMQRKEA